MFEKEIHDKDLIIDQLEREVSSLCSLSFKAWETSNQDCDNLPNIDTLKEVDNKL